MRSLVSFALAVLLFASESGCAPQADEPRAVRLEQAIVNGTPDTSVAHRAVVLLADSTGFFFCTGTLVAPQVVLTAAHCVDGRSADGLRAGFGDGLADPGLRWVKASELAVHPGWSRREQVDDLALLRLGAPAPDAIEPVPALPSALALGPGDTGVAVQFCGFGRTESNADGLKLEVSDTLDCICDDPAGCDCLGRSVGSGQICYDQQPGGPCTGDSGGPAFVTIEGREYVAGITSYGDPDCASFGCSTKVDRYEEFIRAFVGEIDSAADRSASDGGDAGVEPDAGGLSEDAALPPDAGVPDAEIDFGPAADANPDAGPGESPSIVQGEPEAAGCSAGGASPATAPLVLLMAAAALLRRRIGC